MSDPEKLELVVPVAVVVGAVTALIGYGAYSLWKRVFPDRSDKYDSGPLLESIKNYSENLIEISSILKEKDDELTILMLHEENPLTDKQKNTLRARQVSWQALTTCIQQRPIVNEYISTQHEANQQSQELTEYVLKLHQLKQTFLSDHEALIGELQPRSTLSLSM